MEDENSYLRELLQERGWYKKWYTHVMADILTPHVKKLAKPYENCALTRFMEQDHNLLSLYMVKEFLKNVGLRSTERIFELEADLCGMDQDLQNFIQSELHLLKQSTSDHLEPPLLSQALQIWKESDLERYREGFSNRTEFEASGSLDANAIINSMMQSQRESCIVSTAEINNEANCGPSQYSGGVEHSSDSGYHQYNSENNNSPNRNRSIGNCKRCSK